MEFEWDPAKSLSNARKHGISFEESRTLFADPECIEVRLAYPDERGKHWTAIVTYRGGRTRIISVRRSHPNEERAYDENV